jgi:hypothetical protein
LGKIKIKPKTLHKKDWGTIGLAMDRLKLYLRFLPTQHTRALESQSKNDLDLTKEPDFKQLGQLRIGRITSISPEESILRMQAPLMEWEVYWETIYKSVYLINFISGFPQCSNAANLYKNNIDYFGKLENARYTFAHFAERLPGMEKAGDSFSVGISDSSYQFGDTTWSNKKEDLDYFIDICLKFISLAEFEYNLWLKSEFHQNNVPDNKSRFDWQTYRPPFMFTWQCPIIWSNSHQ